MRVVIFTHSLVSDWNHGNAHFLRGLAGEFKARDFDLDIYEPRNGWSRQNLIAQHGTRPLEDFEREYPLLRSTLYDPDSLHLDRVLDDPEIVMVHEWNEPSLVAQIGLHRATKGGYQLYFHDTHHRSVTDPSSMAAYDLRHYDGVLAYGAVIREIYLRNGWTRKAWTWHEAADTAKFYPRKNRKEGDLVWIGNWGDDERVEELREFLIQPVEKLGLKARVYGVRYPESALKELAAAGIEYQGWLPNYKAPEVFAGYRVTLHIPRRPYATALPGIPTIRPFEAMACGIPLISAPWNDSEKLFRQNRDYLSAANGAEMTEMLRSVLAHSDLADSLTSHGLETVRARHTCAHRVDELLSINDCAGRTAAVRGAA